MWSFLKLVTGTAAALVAGIVVWKGIEALLGKESDGAGEVPNGAPEELPDLWAERARRHGHRN